MINGKILGLTGDILAQKSMDLGTTGPVGQPKIREVYILTAVLIPVNLFITLLFPR